MAIFQDLDIKPHNQKAYEAILAAWESHARACIIHPTGSGKSVIYLLLFQWILSKNPASKILFVSSYNIILDGMRQELINDSLLTSNIYLTLYCHLEDYASADSWDYLFLDEFHHGGASKTFNHLVSILDHLAPHARVVGGSATPFRDSDHKDMSLILFQNVVASRITLHDAMAQGILPVPRYLICDYDILKTAPALFQKCDQQFPSRKDLKRLRKKAAADYRHIRGMKGFFEDFLLYPHGKYIVFCRNLQHLNQMLKTFQEDWLSGQKVQYYICHSHLSRKSRQNALSDFQNENPGCLQLLFCVDMLSEGIHIPLDGIIMFRPTHSLRIYLQQLGRVLSVLRHEHPQIIDMVNNFRVFQPKKSADGSSFIPEGTPFPWTGLFEPVVAYQTLVETLYHMRNLTHRYPDWMSAYEQAKKFFHQHGHLRVPRGTHAEADGIPFLLDVWVNDMRNAYHRENFGRLKQDAILLLEEIGMEWEYDPDWEEIYEMACLFYREFHHLHITRKNCPPGYALDRWLIRMRRRYYGKIKPALTEEQIEKLNRIGMEWNPRASAGRTDQKIEALTAFYNDYQHLRIPDTAEFAELEKYYRSLKKLYCQPKKLTDAQREKLEAIGFGEHITPINQKHLAELRTWLSTHKSMPKEGPLFRWLNRMNQDWLQGELSHELHDALLSLGYTFVKRRNTYSAQDVRNTALEYYAFNQTLQMPRNHFYQGIPLGECLHSIQRKARNQKLTEEESVFWSTLGLITYSKCS